MPNQRLLLKLNNQKENAHDAKRLIPSLFYERNMRGNAHVMVAPKGAAYRNATHLSGAIGHVVYAAYSASGKKFHG